MNPLHQNRQVIILGGAIVDIVANTKALPVRGGDIEIHETDRQVGGCAFNVARAMHRLGVKTRNAIPVGNGSNGQMVERSFAQEGLEVLLRNPSQDNGWSLGLVEPDGERTFISATGCEVSWNESMLDQIHPHDEPTDAILYLSGYELSASQNSDPNDSLLQWVLDLPREYSLFVDLGPRIADIDTQFLNKLLDRDEVVLTINRDEAELLCSSVGLLQGNNDNDVLDSVSLLAKERGIDIIYRLGGKGAHICCKDGLKVNVPPYETIVVDTIGAGDTHCAGVLSGLACGWSLEDAVDLGNKIAAVVVGRSGASQPPTAKEIMV